MTSSDGPSAHLTWDELACNNGVPYPVRWRHSRAIPLSLVFEAVRRTIGGPIRINSAYRTIEYNRAVGGSRKGQHPEGRALDLGLPRGMLMKDFLAVVLEVARYPSFPTGPPTLIEGRLTGIGVYPTFIHIDTRPSVRLVRWNGTRVSAELVRTA